MLENWGSPANPWLPRSPDVLVRCVINLSGIFRLYQRVWLRQLPANYGGYVGDRLGKVIFEANSASHARHSHIQEVVEPVSQEIKSLHRVLDGECQ